MRPRILLWSVQEGKLVKMTEGSFAQAHKEKDLETWIEQDPSLLGRTLTILGRQVYIPKAGFLDLLALDEEGRLVVIEFKRQQSTRDTIAQILDYATSVRLMSLEDIRGLTGIDQSSVGDILDVDPAMILVAAEAEEAVERIVDYLAGKAQLPIEVVTFTYATLEDGREVIARSILTPDPSPAPVAKTNSKITLSELFTVASERGVLEYLETLHEIVKQGWSVEMFRNNGGQVRYWRKLPLSGWRVVLGLYVGSEKYGASKGELDVWIRPERVAEYTESTPEDIRNELQLFTLQHETTTATVIRISNAADAERLYALLQQWNVKSSWTTGRDPAVSELRSGSQASE